MNPIPMKEAPTITTVLPRAKARIRLASSGGPDFGWHHLPAPCGDQQVAIAWDAPSRKWAILPAGSRDTTCSQMKAMLDAQGLGRCPGETPSAPPPGPGWPQASSKLEGGRAGPALGPVPPMVSVLVLAQVLLS
ncbi:hypothetical protein E2320_018004 [Naja naja]|nr:hypothetical protein E2320_018004 [Naja naja]